MVLITLGRVSVKNRVIAWVQPENPLEWNVSEGRGTVSEHGSVMNIDRWRDHQWIEECDLYLSTFRVILGENRKLNARFDS